MRYTLTLLVSVFLHSLVFRPGTTGQLVPTPLTSSDYEELRDEFLQKNGDELTTAASSEHSPPLWHDDQSSFSVGHTATEEPTTTGAGHENRTSTTAKDEVEDDAETEEDESPGSEPIGLAAPTVPPSSSYESLENLVIVGPNSTIHDGLILTEDGGTVSPWHIDQLPDTREILPTHPPGTFPGAIESESTTIHITEHNDSLSDAVTLGTVSGGATESGTTTTATTEQNESLNDAATLGNITDTNSTVENNTLAAHVENENVALTSTVPVQTEASSMGSFFVGNNNEDSVLILNDAVGGTGSFSNGDLNVTAEPNWPTVEPKIIPTVWPYYPPLPGDHAEVTRTDDDKQEEDGPTYNSAVWFQHAVAAYSLIACGLTILGIVLCCCVYGSCCGRRKGKREYQVSGAGRDGKSVNSPLLRRV